MQCSYGSIWRKWDFHVHTPYSILNNNYGFNPFELTESDLETEFDEYVKKLFTLAVENNVAAIGITDYFMLEGYKRIKEKYLSSPSKMLQCFPDDELRRKIEKIFIFPNVELRLENFVGRNANSVNYHVIFSNDITIQDIEENFLHQLIFNYDSGNTRSLTLSNIKELGSQIKTNNNDSGSDLLVGLNHVTVNYADIQKVLENNPTFRNKYLITVPVDEDLSQISWNGRDYSTRRNIYKQCHCLLTTLWNAWEEQEKYGGLSFKAGNTLTDVLSYIFKNWYNIHYIVKSGNDSIESMSPGKKALVLLEMLISLEDSKCPILIDQPEDDLDNRSIYNDLVQYIRRKKKERQIIIVTHNANVVLGADAEEIIIANQDGTGTKNAEKRFEYRSGAIENDEILTDDTGVPLKGILNQKGIQTQICDILEGGRPAFKLRQNKYAGIQHD